MASQISRASASVIAKPDPALKGVPSGAIRTVQNQRPTLAP